MQAFYIYLFSPFFLGIELLKFSAIFIRNIRNVIVQKNMDNKNCEEIIQNRIDTIVLIFKKQLLKETERIVSCLYSCFQEGFIKWATITYKHYPEESILFISNNSFTDGILKFKEKAESDDIYKSNASLKTILFSFYRFKLLENLKKEQRLLIKNERYERDNKEGSVWMGEDDEIETRYLILEHALEKMEPVDKQIIVWRHIEEKSCDEIAQLLAINRNSATTRIYRCMKRLRNLIEQSN